MSVTICLGCENYEEFDHLLGKGHCYGNGKHQVEAIALNLVATGSAPNLAVAMDRSESWKWPVVFWNDRSCGNFKAPGP